jgi:hypothetical protein
VRGHASGFQHNTMVVIAEENVELHGQLPGGWGNLVDKCVVMLDKLLN